MIKIEILADCCTKIEILQSLHSDIAAQVVAEWMEDNERLELASGKESREAGSGKRTSSRREVVLALLLCFDSELGEQLIAHLKLVHLKQLTLLSLKANILTRLRGLRKRALHLFYRDIAGAEFARSPLGLRLRDPNWLGELSGEQILQLMLNIPTELRAALLACLSPLRVSKAMLLCKADADKQKLMKGLQAINLVSEDDIDNLLQFLDTKGKRFALRRMNAPKTARYLGAVINNLSKDDSYQMLTALQTEPQLLRELNQHFLPFASIAHLEPEEIATIFVERQERDIAYILFNTDGMTRDTVLNALPEVQRLGTKQELRKLETDNDRRSANLHLSARLQLEVRNYLRAAAEGMAQA